VLQITPLERTALRLLANGTATNGLADRLGMDAREIEARLDALFARMGVTGRAEALAAAGRRGLLIPDDPAQDAFAGGYENELRP
jgi:DNA-binding NarL/FixJ family response regulator